MLVVRVTYFQDLRKGLHVVDESEARQTLSFVQKLSEFVLEQAPLISFDSVAIGDKLTLEILDMDTREYNKLKKFIPLQDRSQREEVA